MFNTNPNAACVMLKPCCLPGMSHAKEKVVWKLGKHCFPAAEVCTNGKWEKNSWTGPRRDNLIGRFKLWGSNLYQGIDVDAAEKELKDIQVQRSHFQNTFIFGQRCIVGDTIIPNPPPG